MAITRKPFAVYTCSKSLKFSGTKNRRTKLRTTFFGNLQSSQIDWKRKQTSVGFAHFDDLLGRSLCVDVHMIRAECLAQHAHPEQLRAERELLHNRDLGGRLRIAILLRCLSDNWRRLLKLARASGMLVNESL